MPRCFVIQPFDRNKFDQRYRDSYKPAIESAGYEPYRIDMDVSVQIPIQEIEDQIRNADVCFADISLDNPNVWYELGFAYACKKDVVMVCSNERLGNFPFDIAHKFILKYNTGSKSDFLDLETQLTDRLIAISKNNKTANILVDAPVVASEGLKSHEIAIVLFIGTRQYSEIESLSTYILKDEMSKAGYTDIATSVGLSALKKMGMVCVEVDNDWNNHQYLGCRLTPKGEEWLVSNQEKLEFRKVKVNIEDAPDDDDLPF
jgi:hypothetical protein